MNGSNENEATSPPRKKPRKGKKKSKAERLARGLNTSILRDNGEETISLDALQALLEAPSSSTSVEWDRAQAIAMRLGTTEAKQLMVRSLIFGRQSPKAAVHYARRLQLLPCDLLVVLTEGRDDPVRCLCVAKFLVDADVGLVDNIARITQFILPWLDMQKVGENDAQGENKTQEPLLSSSFLTAARLVLQPHASQNKPSVLQEKTALQRALVMRLLADQSRHSGVILQYASALAPVLESAASISTTTIEHDGDSDGNLNSSLWSNADIDTEQLRRSAVASRVEDLLKMLWPDARVSTFGSSATNLLVPAHSSSSSSSSTTSDDDVDLCVILPSCPQFLEDTAPLITDIKDHLELYDASVNSAVAVIRARVPIVKWTDPVSQLQCDLCVNNLPALWNTQLTIQLTQYDTSGVVRAFSVWIKTWYKNHRVEGGFASAISSYGMQLLVLYFLQRHGVLPASINCGEPDMEFTSHHLQSLDVAGIQKQVQRSIQKAADAAVSSSTISGSSSTLTTTPSTSLWSLVVAFFAFYGANGFDFEHQVVSLCDVALTKPTKQWTRRTWRYSLSIEDPIERHRDLGTLFSRVSLTRFRLLLVKSCVVIAVAHETRQTTTNAARQRVLEELLKGDSKIAL